MRNSIKETLTGHAKALIISSLSLFEYMMNNSSLHSDQLETKNTELNLRIISFGTAIGEKDLSHFPSSESVKNIFGKILENRSIEFQLQPRNYIANLAAEPNKTEKSTVTTLLKEGVKQ